MRRDESFQPVSLAFDRTTFDRLVLEHLPAAQRFAIRLTGDPNAAEDLMQDALLKAHRSWQTFRGESRFQTWLFQIVINCFRDGLGRQDCGEQFADVLEVADDRPEPARCLQGRELGELVALEVSNLPPRQREVLVLITYEQMSIREVSGVLNLNEQNVRTNLHYARETLRRRLRKYLDE
jgi:RNA polymerase sigma-70 factor (ECF subfamily)